MPAARRRYYVAHFVLVGVVALLTLAWVCFILSTAELGDGGRIGSAILLSAVMVGLGVLVAYVLVTSVLVLVLRGHWSALVADVLLAGAAVALMLT